MLKKIPVFFGKNESKYNDDIWLAGGISIYECFEDLGVRESQRCLLKIKNPSSLALYYIGLTYFKMHDFGNAVLYFEKSLSKKEEFEYTDRCMRFLVYSYYYLEKFDLLFDSPLTKNDEVIKFFSFIIPVFRGLI